MNLLFSLFGVLLLTSWTLAEETATFDLANRQFQSGDFTGAASNYEKTLASSGPRASVFYNLGNAYQKLGKYGPAILAYERARLLTPRDPDLLANLARARKAATAFEETGLHTRLDPALKLLSRNEWSWLVAGAATFLGCLAVLCGAVRLPRRGLRRAAGASAWVAAFAVFAGAAVLYVRRDESSRGVILSENATIRLSPFDAAESLGTPGPGRIVFLRGSAGDFRYVEVAGAELRGWLHSNDVAAIMPETPSN
jgi:tetratricopeptide (TPR) repeat protein